MPISTRTHGILDYATAGALLALPRLLGWSRPLSNAVSIAAIGKLTYSALTRHELGIVKVIPMTTHLVLDAIGGLAVTALPHIFGDDRRDGATSKFILSAIGLLDLAAVPATHTRSVPTRGGMTSRASRRSRGTPARATPVMIH